MKVKQIENENHLSELLKSLRLSPPEELGRHLTDEEIVGYLTIDDHLATCQECAEEMERMIEAAEMWRRPDFESKGLDLRERLRKHIEQTQVQVEPGLHLLSQPAERPSPRRIGSVEVRQDVTWPKSSKPLPYLVAVDIGSSKVGVLIGQCNDQGGVDVVGKGIAPNRGTRKGAVVNIEATVEALKQASEEAEVMAGVEISRAYVGMSGADIRSINSRGMVSVARKDREITRADIQRVLESAQSAALPPDREIVHAIPQEFIVDEQGGISEPLGMLGSRLEVAVHLVTANVTRARTLLTCVNRAGIEVVELVFEPLAAAEAVLTPGERDLGVLLCDVGAGTTQYAYFSEGEIQYSAVTPIGAGHFTNDLAMVLRTPFAEAERIKVRVGCCLPSMLGEEEGIAVPSVSGGTSHIVPKRELCEILQPRAEELLQLIREDLAKHLPEHGLRGGIVLTGGGANLDGLLALAEQVFNCSVRYGLPRGLGGLSDTVNTLSWSTASGLLVYGAAAEENPNPGPAKRPGLSVRNMMGSLRGMFSDLF